MPDLAHGRFRHTSPLRAAGSGLWIRFHMTGVDPSDGPVSCVRDGFIGVAEAQVSGKETICDQFTVAGPRDHDVRLKTAIALTRGRTIQ